MVAIAAAPGRGTSGSAGDDVAGAMWWDGCAVEKVWGDEWSQRRPSLHVNFGRKGVQICLVQICFDDTTFVALISPGSPE